jgi:putative serine protease PepD
VQPSRCSLSRPASGANWAVPRYAETDSTVNPSVEQIATEVLPSVVTLTTEPASGELHEGSGVILTSDGLIMTNNHVVAAAGDVSREPVSSLVSLNDGRTAPFSIVASDPKSDIAVVRAEGISGLTPIQFGSAVGLRVGQPVAAVGSLLGLTGTVTVGIVSALDRPVFGAGDGDTQFAAFDAMQTDAALNPGNSGGALVDMNGHLIGMNSAAASLGSLGDGANGEAGSIGIGFAIPVDHAARIAGELIATGTASHAWLGAQVGTDMDADARIVGVTNGSPAAVAGLRTGALVRRSMPRKSTTPARCAQQCSHRRQALRWRWDSSILRVIPEPSWSPSARTRASGSRLRKTAASQNGSRVLKVFPCRPTNPGQEFQRRHCPSAPLRESGVVSRPIAIV